MLVVDDDPGHLRLVSATLRDDAFNVVTAVNGREALAVHAATSPSVVVLDLEMPVMDGRAFIRELRSRGYDTPVLVLSAYGARGAMRELAIDAAMEKPFDPERLAARVHDLAGRRSGDR